MPRKPILAPYSGKMSRTVLEKAKKLKERTGLSVQDMMEIALDNYIKTEVARLSDIQKPKSRIKKKVVRK